MEFRLIKKKIIEMLKGKIGNRETTKLNNKEKPHQDPKSDQESDLTDQKNP